MPRLSDDVAGADLGVALGIHIDFVAAHIIGPGSVEIPGLSFC